MKNKGKRGFFLAEETLKIILSIIVIGFLVYLLASLYFSNKGEDLKFAESSMDYLVGKLNNQTKEIQIYNPEGWSILSWPYEGEMPLVCSNFGWKNCLCICEKPTLATSSNYLDNCDDESAGICVESLFEVRNGDSQTPIIIDSPPITLKIDYSKKTISNK